MWQQPFINAITRALAHEHMVHALFLGGSFGRGEADEYSDLDFVAMVKTEDQVAFADLWRREVEAIVPVVHWYRALGDAPIYNAIGVGWERIDLAMAEPADTAGRARDNTRPLIDRAGLFVNLPATLSWPGADPARVSHLAAEFLRILGLLPVGVGRGEWLVLRAGLDLQRSLLFQLLSEEVARADKGGMLAWTRRLPLERIAMLEGLPEARLSRASLIDAYLALAFAFLPPARVLAKKCGAAWPQALEDATWAYLAGMLEIERPAEI